MVEYVNFDLEMIFALRVAQRDARNGAHTVSRHGAYVQDGSLEARSKTGIAPDGKPSPTRCSTRFSSNQHDMETYEIALKMIAGGKSKQGMPVDLNFGPGLNGNLHFDRYSTEIDHLNRGNIANGYEGIGTSRPSTFKTSSGGTFVGDTWPVTQNITNPIYRAKTNIRWNGTTWELGQHFPVSEGINPTTGQYFKAANAELR